jgi:hypothetical protein
MAMPECPKEVRALSQMYAQPQGLPILILGPPALKNRPEINRL